MSNMPPPPPASPPPGFPPPGDSAGGHSPVEPKNGLGTAALVLGIISILAIITIVGGIVFGLIGAILGFIGRSRFKKDEATNGGVALAGIITSLLGIVGSVAIVVGLFAIFGDDFDNLNDCLESANTEAEEQECADDFADDLVGDS